MPQTPKETQTNTSLFTAITTEEAIAQLSSSWGGITETEAQKRLEKYGKNKLPTQESRKWTGILLRQFSDPIVWILLVAGVLAGLFGEFRDVTIIATIILINAIIGFSQEYKAEKILHKLQNFTTDYAVVIRDGEKKEINSRELVPGDIVFLDAGASVPADARIVESFALKVNSFVFTGESRPEKRDALPMSQAVSSPADAGNMLFLGESIAVGEARALIVGTGHTTELGHLAHLTASVSEDPTPLQKKMESLSRTIAIIAVIIGGVVIGVGRLVDLSWYDSFLLALALAVSVVPEGLPAAISVAFALGMKRLLRFNILAKKLSAVETLGSVTTICTDKTGTITRGELTVTKIITENEIIDVSGQGYDLRGEFSRDGKTVSPGDLPNANILFKIAVLCNDAGIVAHDDGKNTIVGDGTEGALLVVARKYNANPDYFHLGETKIFENPFSSDRMRMSVVFRNHKTLSLVKGSPDVLLTLAVKRLENGVEKDFTETEKMAVRETYNTLSAGSLRALGFAYRDMRDVPESDYTQESEKNLVWVGMMAMTDPPRTGTREALDECRALGLRAIMITGDYEVTAQAIAEDVGLISRDRPYEVISGARLETMSNESVFTSIRDKDVVFARIAPDAKLRIANILKDHNETIAMTGDGVNDAPALKRADIGVAMGIIGTDVSKEASDMILLDDNFASIVKGVREGRTIFRNLKKFAHYVFTSNASELMTVTAGFALGIPAPITAVQILAIDLGTDVLPSLALGVEPEEPTKSKVEDTQSIINRQGLVRILSIAVIMTLGAITAFLITLLRGGWEWGASLDITSLLYQQATATTYLTLALTQMANLLQSRSANLSFFKLRLFSNPWIWASLIASVGLLYLVTSVAPFQSILDMQSPDGVGWGIALLFTLLVFFFEEWRKKGLTKKSKKKK